MVVQYFASEMALFSVYLNCYVRYMIYYNRNVIYKNARTICSDLKCYFYRKANLLRLHKQNSLFSLV